MTARRAGLGAAIILLLLAGSAFIAVTTGPVPIDISAVLRETWESPNKISDGALIFWYVRVARMVTAGCVGAVLAASGAAFQAILRNPLADPFVLGVSGGAAVGALAAVIFRVDTLLVGLLQTVAPGLDPHMPMVTLSAGSLAAFVGALATVALVHRLSWTGGRLPPQTMLLAGVVVNAFFGAIILLMTSLLDPMQLHGALKRLVGYIPSDPPETLIPLMAASLFGVGVLWAMAWPLNLLSTGDDSARGLGVDISRVKHWVFVAASLATGAVVARTGLIGFVGLVIPHTVRLIWGPDHRFLIPASIGLGAAFLIASDTAARTVLGLFHGGPSSDELPVGVITACVGAPFFLVLLWKEARRA